MKNKRTFVVGAYVAATAVILIIGLLWLAGSRFLRPVERYRVIFRGSISGLLPDASVELNGVSIGKVVDIRLTNDSPPRVAVDLEVRPGTPVRRDSVATLGGSLVTGIRFIQISGGTVGAGALPAGEVIKVDESSFEDIRRQAQALTQETRDVLTSLNHDVLNKPNRQALGQTILDLSATMHNLKTLTSDLASPPRLAALNDTLDNLSRTTRRMNEVAESASATMQTFAAHREQLYTDLSSALRRLNGTLDSADQLMASANALLMRNAPQLEQTTRRISHATRHLDETIDTINADPSVLLWGSGRAQGNGAR